MTAPLSGMTTRRSEYVRQSAAYRAGARAADGAANPFDGLSTDMRERDRHSWWAHGYRSRSSPLRQDLAYRAGFASPAGATNPYDGLSDSTRERSCSRMWFLGMRERQRAEILRSRSYRRWLAARAAE